jgi:hypothetical protein
MFAAVALIAKLIFWAIVGAYVLYGLAFGLAAAFARPGGEP